MRLSIVAEGGGFRAAYVVGVMRALHDHFGLRRADVVSGTSGAAPTMAFYASGQMERCIEGWRNDICSPRMCSISNLLHGRPYIDIDWLIDTVIRTKARFDEVALHRSPILLSLPVTSFTTGKHVYIDVQHSSYSVFEVLRAAMSVPIAYHRAVQLGDEKYFDSQLADPLGLDNPALLGTRKIIIFTRPLTYTPKIKRHFESRLLKPLLSPVAYELMRASATARARATQRCLESQTEGDIVIAPRTDKGRILDNSRSRIHQLVDEGYNDAVRHARLQQFISGLARTDQRNFYFPV